jgi:hypothetical protein
MTVLRPSTSQRTRSRVQVNKHMEIEDGVSIYIYDERTNLYYFNIIKVKMYQTQNFLNTQGIFLNIYIMCVCISDKNELKKKTQCYI